MPPDTTLRLAEEALALARAVGWRASEAYALLNLSLHFAAYGEYGSALDVGGDGLAIAREIGHREWMTAGEWGAGMLLSDLLAPSRADDRFVRAYALGRASGSLHWRHITAAALAENHVARGDLDAAASLLAEQRPDLSMQTLGQRRIWLARAKLALARGDAAGALATVERLVAGAAGRAEAHDIPLLALVGSECLMALGRREEAGERLRATLRIATDRGLLPLQWRSHLALGRWHAAAGDDAAASEQHQAARAIVERLAAAVPDEALRDEFLAHAATLLPADRRPPRRGGRDLTGREWDVAQLVARGCSNRDIAAALSIGERTVETHVAHILAKLGFQSRVEIATWAVASSRGPDAV
ncbi:MAG TPA: LuxR C-terminal-related transcriptional regulator [Thermomicrobiales bacterium]|nr:LuxR C-terminal-related transcriptional regulator [Thermomicrobiales bacterium]